MRRIAWVMLVATAVAAAACSGSGGAPAAPAGGGGAGAPAALDRIEVGMGEQRVLSLLGPPSAEGPYTPRAARLLSPLGVDGARRTYFYEGAGRVLFTGGGPLLRTGTVERVERDPDEPGKRR